MPLDRHCQIMECIKDHLVNGLEAERAEYAADNTNDPYLVNPYDQLHQSFQNIRIEDFDETQLPSHGIIISPDTDAEAPGTNESTDVIYSSLVMRVVHALGNEDKERRLAFRQLVRQLFHRKKLTCGTECLVVSTVEFGPVKVPKAWKTENKSITIQRVKWLVREPHQ